ncbi:MAG TPA: SCO family protein [Acidobacteriota bacterium]|jgi:protein SCO1/2
MIETTSYRHSTFDIRHSTFAAVFCFLASVAIAFGQLMAPQVGPPSSRLPQALRDIGIDQKLNEQVPLDLMFRDEQGRSVRLGDYFFRKPVVLSLVYFQCPMLCNQVLNGLASSLGVLSFDVGRQFDVVTVSFDPRDTPSLAAVKKAAYLERYKRSGAAGGWHFLTGEENSIRALARAVGFRYTFNPTTGQFAHASGVVVLTPRGRTARYFYGIEYAPKDLRLGLIEAAEERIGSPVDQILLFCYHYDPSTGKYSAIVLNFVKLGAALMLIALATMFFFLRRKGAGQEIVKLKGAA